MSFRSDAVVTRTFGAAGLRPFHGATHAVRRAVHREAVRTGAAGLHRWSMSFVAGSVMTGALRAVHRRTHAGMATRGEAWMHAMRAAVRGRSRTMHARSAVVHALRTVLRTTVHGMMSALRPAAVMLGAETRTMLRTTMHRMLRAMPGAAMRATAGRLRMMSRVRATGVMAGLAVVGHHAMRLQTAVMLRTMLRAVHTRSVSHGTMLRMLPRLAVCRMLGMFGAFRAGVAGAMSGVRAFMLVGFANVRRRAMAVGARAGVMRHFAMVVAGAVIARLMLTRFMIAVRASFRLAIVMPRLIRALFIGTSIPFGMFGGVGPRERRAFHTGASEPRARRRSARSAGHHHTA